MNICTAILPEYSFDMLIEITRAAGYQGMELRVDAQYHKSLDDLQREGRRIKRTLAQARLQLPILSSYIPIDDERSIDKLLDCCQTMGVPKARVVLPRSCHAAVAQQAQRDAIIPAYDARQEPRALLHSLQTTLSHLERKAAAAGVQLLIELHWGTVMSSFSSAYFFTRDLNPAQIALTFDPANMLVEGKEDWEFGIKLIQPHLANVHVKNVSWVASRAGWVWAWAPLMQGMVNWPDLLGLLKQHHYQGEYAIEDFLTPNVNLSTTIAYLTKLRVQFSQLDYSPIDANIWPGEPQMAQIWN